MGGRASYTRRGMLKLGAFAGAGVAMAAVAGGCSPQPKSIPDVAGDLRQSRTYWLGEEPTVIESDIVEHETTDLLIIGAGNAGMMAAASACDLGLDFIVAEKGNCVCDSREYMGVVNSVYSLAKSDPVDTMKLLNELTRYASGRVSQDVIKVWLDEGSEMIEWLEPIMTAAGKTMAVTYMNGAHPTGGTDYMVPTIEHYFEPTYTAPMRNDILEEFIQRAGNEIRYGHDLVKLDHENTKVTGAVFKTANGLKRITASKGTLLATGGYAANPEMVRAIQPSLERCITQASFTPRCDGYGLRAGLWAGGVKDPDGAPVIFDRGAVKPGVDSGYVIDEDGNQSFPGTHYQLNIGSQPFLKVNRRGRRFCNESMPYDSFANAAGYQPGGVWCQIFDANAPEQIMNQFQTIGCAKYTGAMLSTGMTLDDYIAMDGGIETVVKADTIEQLADMLGFEGEDKKTLLKTIEHYNSLVDSGEDTDYGKEPYRLSKIIQPPFYGCWFGGSLLTTLDGLRINENMQVLTAENEVIEGLYAAGDVSGCFFSNNYPEYIVAVACGRTCTEGRHVARYLAGDLVENKAGNQ